MPLEIRFAPAARAMLDDADERWIEEHGIDVDNPLLDQVERAVALLRDTPELGIAYTRSGHTNIRRLLLRSGWHLYYRYEPAGALVEVVAVWFAGRGNAPPL